MATSLRAVHGIFRFRFAPHSRSFDYEGTFLGIVGTASRNIHRRFLQALLLTISLFLAGRVLAQVDPNVEDGIHPYGSYAGSPVDTVSLTSGNLTLRIPLFSVPQRGKLRATLTIGLPRNQFTVIPICNTPQDTCTAKWYLPAAGPGIYVDVEAATSTFASGVTLGAPIAPPPDPEPEPDIAPTSGPGPNSTPQQCNQSSLNCLTGNVISVHPQVNSGTPPYRYEATDQQGGVHQMVASPTGQGYVASDGSGFYCQNCRYDYAVLAGDTYTPDGLRQIYQGTTAVTTTLSDSNGNNIVSQNGAITGGSSITSTPLATDSLGRQNPWGVFSVSGDGTGTAGCNPLSTQSAFQTLVGPNGYSRILKVCYGSINYQTALGGTYYDVYGGSDPIQEGNGSVFSITSVLLFDGNSWSTSPAWRFGYDSAADVNSITLPTGAQMAYNWIPVSLPCSQYTATPVNMWIGSRTVTVPGSPTVSDSYFYVSGRTQVTGTSGTVWYNFYNPLDDLLPSNGQPHNQYDTATPCVAYETSKIEWSDPSATTVLRETDTTYQSQLGYTVVNSPYGPFQTSYAINVLPKTVTTTVDGIPQSKTSYVYDSALGGLSYGKVLQKKVYDFVNPNVNPANHTFPAVTSCTETTYAALSGPNNATYLAENLLNLPRSTAIYWGDCPDPPGTYPPTGSPVEETFYGYDESAVKPSGASLGYAYMLPGNLTSVSRMQVSPAGNPVVSKQTFWDTGLPYQSTDAAGNVTAVSYDPSYAFAYPTLKQMPQANGVTHQVSASYDFSTGLVTSFTDENSQTSVFGYDALDRVWTVHYPDTGTSASALSKVFCYPDLRTVTEFTATSAALSSTSSSENCPATGTSIKKTFYFDGLGRTLTTSLFEDALHAISTQTTWNSMGLVNSVTNPYRSTSDLSYDLITYVYDGIGRKRSATRSSDSSQQTFSYAGNQWTFTDESSHSWTRSNDGLGRLIGVTEPGSLQTTYSYNVLGNLTGVYQLGNGSETARSRSFTYDSLSRLTSSTNPETGTIRYTYSLPSGSFCAGDAGLPCLKTDARGITTSYIYDSLNRLSLKRYSDGTWTSGFGYDGFDQTGQYHFPGLTNSIGRMSDFANTVNAATIFSYDPMGRVNAETLAIPSDLSYTLGLGATYDYAGHLTDLVYPDAFHVHQGYDAAGRLGTVGDGTAADTFIKSLTYNADGSVQATELGRPALPNVPGISQTVTENSHLQVQSMMIIDSTATPANQLLLSHTYCYVLCSTFGGPLANNGNLYAISDNLSGTRSQAFTYDGLNRISSFTLGQAGLQHGANDSSGNISFPTGSGLTGQQYLIDSFGNMSGVANGQAVNQFDPSTNRISNLPCAGSTQAYDASGNQLCDTDPYGMVRQYTYDAESRVTFLGTLQQPPFEGYSYGADGSRVRKNDAIGNFTDYVYFEDQPIAEKDQTGAWTDYVFANGKRVARVSATTSTLHTQGTRNDPSVNQACGTAWNVSAATWTPKPIAAGDRLVWFQKEINAQGGLTFMLDGNELLVTPDDQGQPYTFTDSDQTQRWHKRSATIDTGYNGESYVGRLLENAVVTTQNTTGPVDWQQWLADAVVVSKDGTVTAVLTGAPVSSSLWSACGVARPYLAVDQGTTDGDQMGTHFFLADHLGSAQMEFSAAGWPVAMSQFMPFGAEINPPVTANHYKFTGKERDSESGLDYFGARYYASSMGRWMSPDWADKPEAVPYSKLTDPQSLNLYSYVGNNPLSHADADGHCSGDDCGKVTVTATTSGNAPLTSSNGGKTATAEGTVQYKFTYNGKPLTNTTIHEDISNKSSRDGVPDKAKLTTGDGPTGPANGNAPGTIPDTSSISISTPFGGAEGMMTDSVFSKDTTQTLSFQTPTGSSCSVTCTRTLSNADSKGQPTDQYKIKLTSPATQQATPVKPPPPPKPPTT